MAALDAVDTGVPQSDSDAIARRLLGDDLVNRYGDVIGTRPAGAADALRDFTVAFKHGQTKVDELKLKVRESYQESYTKAQRNALAAKQADIEQSKAILDAIKTVQSLPPGQRAAVLKETLDSMGLPYSNAAIKMFTDSDLYAQLPMNELDQAANEGKLSTAEISGVMGSALNAAKFMSETSQKKRAAEQTGNLILDAENKKLKQKELRQKLMLDRRFKANERALSIKNAKLGVKLKEKALAAPTKQAGLTGIPEIDAELAGSSVPPPPPAEELDVADESPAAAPPAVVTPGQSDVDAAKARLGLR